MVTEVWSGTQGNRAMPQIEAMHNSPSLYGVLRAVGKDVGVCSCSLGGWRHSLGMVLQCSQDLGTALPENFSFQSLEMGLCPKDSFI